MRKSLGIFCFYDPQGIVDDYILFLIRSLKGILNRIITVVNGEICSESYDKLNDLVDDIVIRENVGFDSAAYKEILLNHCSLYDWDEIVLFNGTFYGPFVDWQLIFDKMQKYDFWGLDRDATYEKTHLGSYFLVFERRLICDTAFVDFWAQMKTPSSYFEDFKVFEEPLVDFFSKRGFSWSDWYSENGGVKKTNGPIYRNYLLEDLVENYKFPIVKYKCFSVVQYSKALKNKEYIIERSAYNYALIEQHHSRLEDNNKMYPFSKKVLDEFLDNHDAVYIFGHGVYGKGIAEYCEYKEKEIKGFVVSNPNEVDEISINDLSLDTGDGLIVAVGAGLIQEIKTNICMHLPTNAVLFPI